MKNIQLVILISSFKLMNYNLIRRKLYQYVSVLCSAVLLMACGEPANKSEKATLNLEEGQIAVTKAQYNANNMQLGKLSERFFPSVVHCTGMIDVPPQSRAIVSSFAGGYVQKTPLLIGNKVVKGQLLATLQNPEFVEMQQNFLETAEQLNYLKSEYERQKTLVEEEISSQKNFLRAESNYKSALALYNGLKKKLQMLNIDSKKVEAGNITSEIALYAPIHGSITKINVSKGTYVSPADEIMEIINTDHIHLELSIFEKDILKIKEGQDIIFSIPEALDTTFKAKVYLVGTSIDNKNRTVTVHGHLEDDDNHNFALGMFVDAQIITESSQELALPNDAIITLDDRHYVLLTNSKQEDQYIFDQKEVTIGTSSNGYTRIKNTADFTENDQFLIKGAFSLIRAEE
ncbi:MAG: efflux RND transporter periplasmic adaptor subunit [Eudoraea sp.]|nr:efflux RND transporter periplasmic adaptor subunit [Eudoraea sp.]